MTTYTAVTISGETKLFSAYDYATAFSAATDWAHGLNETLISFS